MKTCWVSRGKRGKRNRCEGYNPNTCVGRRCTLGKEFIEKHGCLTYTKCANASLTPDTPIKKPCDGSYRDRGWNTDCERCCEDVSDYEKTFTTTQTHLVLWVDVRS